MNEPDKELTGCRIVDAVLAQRLTYPLNDSAVQLALNDHWIDDSADVVDGGVVDELHDPGLWVDFYFGDMSAAGKAKVVWIVVGLFLQPRLERLERVVVRHVGGECDVREFFLAVSADHRERATLKGDVLLACLQEMRSDLLALGDDFIRGPRQRGPTDDKRARPVGAHAELHLVGIPKHDVDVFERHAKLFA